MRDRQTGMGTRSISPRFRSTQRATHSRRSRSFSRSDITVRSRSSPASRLSSFRQDICWARRLLWRGFSLVRQFCSAAILAVMRVPFFPIRQTPCRQMSCSVESTYGDRDHVADDNGEELAQVVRSTVERGGKLIIPAFAIGRVEELLYWMRRLEQERRIPVLPVYVDSPMANGGVEVLLARVSRSSTRTCARPRRTSRRSRPRDFRRCRRRSNRRN